MLTGPGDARWNKLCARESETEARCIIVRRRPPRHGAPSRQVAQRCPSACRHGHGQPRRHGLVPPHGSACSTPCLSLSWVGVRSRPALALCDLSCYPTGGVSGLCVRRRGAGQAQTGGETSLCVADGGSSWTGHVGLAPSSIGIRATVRESSWTRHAGSVLAPVGRFEAASWAISLGPVSSDGAHGATNYEDHDIYDECDYQRQHGIYGCHNRRCQ